MVVVTTPIDLLRQFLERRRAKKLARAKQIIEDGRRFFERKRKYDEQVARLLATPPRELIEQALEAAGLPKDITKVAGHWCVYAVPMGSTKHCLVAHIDGIKLDLFLNLKVSCGESKKHNELWYRDGKWRTWLYGGDLHEEIPVHDLVIL